MDLPIARVVVSDLDALASARGDLADTQNQLTVQSSLTADAGSNLADAQKVIAAQNLQLADQTKSCTAQITTLKAAARKSKLRWFGAGYVAGFVSGLLVAVK